MRLLVAITLFALSLAGQSRITGIVVNSATGEPLAGASVSVPASDESVDEFGFHRRSADLIHPSRTITDAAGRFTFETDTGLASVHLAISHPGFRSEDNHDTATIAVIPGDAKEIRVALVPISVIHGTITTDDHTPLPAISVQAIRIEIHEGRQIRSAFATQKTNDRGEYRFEALPPGAYFLRATSAPSAPAAYGPIYFPNATNPDSAQPLRVGPGTAVAADFTLDSHRTYTIHGIITNPPPRRPLAMRLVRGDDPLDNTATVTPNGSFEMTSVAPGTYLLQAYTPNSTPPDFGEATVTVTDHDVAATKIKLTNGVDVTGHVEFRGNSGSEHYASIHAAAVDARRWPVNIAEPSMVADPRGNFVLRNLLPGQYDIAVRGLSDFYVAEIRSGGTDVLTDGLTIEPDNAPHLNVVMQAGGGQIEGTIDGGASSNFVVAMLAKHGTAQVPTIVRAIEGHFHAAGLTPGEYTLYAWPESREIEYRNPAALAVLSDQSLTLNVADGVTSKVILKPSL